MRGKKKLSALTAKTSQQDLVYIGQWMEAGKVRATIDRCYPLSEAADAIRYIETGHAHGKVVITVAQPHRD
jgi:NADPH:quinone reductase-like Zn-dependent oxidoreductase